MCPRFGRLLYHGLELTELRNVRFSAKLRSLADSGILWFSGLVPRLEAT